MALYFYQAFSAQGKKISGYIDASGPQNARESLSRQGIYPTKIELSSSQAAHIPWYKRIFQRSIKLKDKIFFTKQLSVLLKSGIPLVQALDLLVEQTEGNLRTIVITLRDGLNEGRSLADGLQKYPAIFDNIFVQLVRAGEASGKLEAILVRLTDYLERREELRKTITGALRYPLIQLCIIILVAVALLAFVVPQITSVFSDQGITLPLVTRILVGISDFFLSYYIILIGIVIAIVLAFRFWKATPSGAYTIDKIKLKLPLVGFFAKMGAIVQFCRTLGILLEAGVNLSESLNIVTKIVDNKVLTAALEKAKENIIKQGKIAQYLKETGLFPPVAIYLINTGEQSGQLDAMLLTVAGYYEDDLRETADGLSAVLGPVMLVVMGLIVGFIMLAIIMPIQQMSNEAGKLANQ
jgi:type II secretory pathway component PulF